MRRFTPVSPRQSQRGFVIVAVLWILVALSSLAMIFALYLSASAQAMAIGDTALQNEALVSAAAELSAYRLMLTPGEARPARGAFNFRMDDADVSVTFTSEAARIDLNFAPKEALAAFFAVLGAGKEVAQEGAERVVGWRTRPTPRSANEEEARYAASGYSPRQSLFTHVNELALVAGLSPVLVERALPFVTIFNGSPDIDARIAAPEVVAASGKNSDAANGQPKSVVTVKSLCYRVESVIRFAGGRRSISEVVIVLGDEHEPYRVLSWQDDVGPANNPPMRRRS